MLYPIMTKSRVVCDLSGVWKFKIDDGEEGFKEEWYRRPLEEAQTMPVPSSYNDIKEGISHRDHYGWVFYQRDFYVPELLMDQRMLLRFEAVTNEAKVYINGELLCEHKGGYLPFEAEINGKAKEGRNLLTVAVGNIIDYTTLPVGGEYAMMGGLMGTGSERSQKPQNNPNFDFFNYCGITRPVKLYTTPACYIEDISVTSRVEWSGKTDGAGNEKDDGTGHDAVKAILSYAVTVSGQVAKEAETTCCHVKLLNKNDETVAESEGTEGKLIVADPVLWQPLKPYLYRLEICFGEDLYVLPYGIRTVRIDGTRFLINERPFYFKGYGKHEDTFPNGRGVNMPMNCKDISLMKWQNANSFRTSHYPYSEEMMRLCDEEGIVVIDETPAVGVNLKFGGGANFGEQHAGTFDKEHGVKTHKHHKEVVRDMICRDKNFACVVMWSIANEPDSFSEGAYEYFEPLYKLARELDPQKRPCTLVSVQMGATPETDVSAKLSDVICLNRYYGWYFGGPDLVGPKLALENELDRWKALGKPVLLTEYGADTVMGFHDTTPVMYTEEYQVDYYKMNNAVLDERDFVVGEQVWNFADFATSQSLLRVQGNKKGLFTRDRKPKLAAHYFRERWARIPDFDYKQNNV